MIDIIHNHSTYKRDIAILSGICKNHEYDFLNGKTTPLELMTNEDLENLKKFVLKMKIIHLKDECIIKRINSAIAVIEHHKCESWR